MANPVSVTCPEGVWTSVGTNEVFGVLWKYGTTPKYLYAYVNNGNPAPIGAGDGVSIFEDENHHTILSFLGIDVYIMAIGSDGEIRADWMI